MKTRTLVLVAVALAAGIAGTDTAVAQLPPEILVDRQLVRAERLMAEDDPLGALIAMDTARVLQEENELEVSDEFHFTYAQVAYAAGLTERAVEAVNEYLMATGQEGELYREALELFDAAEARLVEEGAQRRRRQREREREERRRAAVEAARQRLAEARRLGPQILWIGRSTNAEYTNAIRQECPARFTGRPSTANVIVIGYPWGAVRAVGVYDIDSDFLGWARRASPEQVCEAIADLSDREVTETLPAVEESSIFLLIDGDGLNRDHIAEFADKCPSLKFTRTAAQAEYFVIGGSGLAIYSRNGTEVNRTNASLMTSRIFDTCRALGRLTR